MYTVIFYVFAAITVVSGFMVATVRNIAHAAFSLMFTLFGVAGIFILLGADFVGVSQLLIYVGGILVLFLFGMMLTSNIDRLWEEAASLGRRGAGVVVSVALLVALVQVVWLNPAWRQATVGQLDTAMPTTSVIGTLFMSDFALLFIASAVVILVALVGAAMIARSDRLTPEDAADRM